MRKEILVLILILVLSLGAAQPRYWEEAKSRPPVRTYAWWSLLYERPNPQRLPVRVRFRWLPVER